MKKNKSTNNGRNNFESAQLLCSPAGPIGQVVKEPVSTFELT